MDNTIPVTKQNTLTTSLVQPAESTKQSAPTITVKLPTKGYFYPTNHPLSSGTIELYHVTAKHEDILSNSNLLKKGTVLDEFLKALIATPGVALNDIFIGDKNALFIESRKNAYGDIDQELKALAKLGTSTSAPEVTTRLKYTIKAIDGETDRAKIKNFIDTQMVAKDSLAFRRHVRETTPDLDMMFDFNCPKCGHTQKMSIPLGANFFWPNLTDRDM
jgi:hypothetical protein